LRLELVDDGGGASRNSISTFNILWECSE